MTHTGKVVLLATVLAGLALPASAQQQQGQTGRMMDQGSMMGPGMMHGPGMGHAGMMGMGTMMGGPRQHIEGRLAFLKAELKITPQQEQVWSVYADSARASASSMQGMHDQMTSSGNKSSTLPERMQWHEQMMSSRLEGLKNLRLTAVPLYNALSPEQKQIADNLMWMM